MSLGDPGETRCPFHRSDRPVAASPLLGYLLFRWRAVEAMPKVRDWMNANVIFILPIL